MAFRRVRAATERAIKAATHLTPVDDGALAALRKIADNLDDQVHGLTPDGKLDNVSGPTYLRYCEALGLTPAGRAKLQVADVTPKGKLGALSAVPRPAAS